MLRLRLTAFVLVAALSLLAAGVLWALPADSDSHSTPATSASNPNGKAAVIRLTGDIDDYGHAQLKLRFSRAKAAGAKVIILEIDTYGGLVTSGLDMSRLIKNQTDVTTIALVNSKALSAGAMIALACDEIVMTPSATLGDCAPIQIDRHHRLVPLQQTERSKAESPVLADFQESAEKRGRSPLLAAAMVSIPYTVYWIEDRGGQRKFVDAAEYQSATTTGDWKPVAGELNPIDGPETLLTVHTEQAVRYGLATGTATSADELASRRGLSIVARYQSGIGARVIALLGSSLVRALLLIVFVTTLFASLHSPGTGPPEALCVLSLGIFVGVPLLTGYAEWGEILIIIAGIALIAFEIFVFPGHFVSLIVGGALLLGGLTLTFVGDIWSIPGGWRIPLNTSALQVGVQVIVISLVCSVLLSMWLRSYLPKLPYFRGLILKATTDNAFPPLAEPLPTTETGDEDRWPFVGTIGIVTSDLKPGGFARFPYADDTRVTSVVSIDGYTAAGLKVVVREVHGSNVVVRRLT